MPTRSMTNKLTAGAAYLDDFYDGIMAGNIPAGVNPDRVFYVDTSKASSGDGRTWDNAKVTIDEAVDAYNALIDWSAAQQRYGCIFVAPGVYAEAPSIPYYCWLIGTGVQGTDTATEIHPTTGSCMTGTLLGTRIINIWFETNQAVDCINGGIVNNSEIAYCTFTNGAAVAATAVSTDNCTHLWFHHNQVESGQTTAMAYGLYCQGGADKFAHNIKVFNNNIMVSTIGIYTADLCTSSEARIYDNDIYTPNSGTAYGIYNGDGKAFVTNNRIASVDAIYHANSATMCVGNSVIDAGTGAKEASGT